MTISKDPITIEESKPYNGWWFPGIYSRCRPEAEVVVSLHSGYTGGGFVEAFDGSLTLGELVTDGYHLRVDGQFAIELWLDTGGNGAFFTMQSGKRSSMGEDSVGTLAPRVIAAPDGTWLEIDATSAYTPREGSAPAGSLSQLRASLGDAMPVSIYAAAAGDPRSGGDIERVGAPGSEHLPCGYPLSVFFNTPSTSWDPSVKSVPRGSAFEAEVRHAYRELLLELPAQTSYVSLDLTRPDGSHSVMTTSVWNEGGWASFTIPASAIEPMVGYYAVEATAVDETSQWLLGSVVRTLTVYDVPAAVGTITATPSAARPGSRVDLSVSLTRAGGLPAVGVAVAWTVTNPAGVVVLERTTATFPDGIARTSVGTHSLSSTTANLFLQTLVPGTYSVSVKPVSLPGLVGTGQFTVAAA